MFASIPLLSRYLDEPLFVVVHLMLVVWSLVIVVRAVNFRRHMTCEVRSLADASGAAPEREAHSTVSSPSLVDGQGAE